MNQNLFQAAQAAQQQGPKPLLEFRAGKMNLDKNTKQVNADKRKGKVCLVVEDGLLHFQWRDRDNNNKTEDNLIIFPGDAKWTKVDKVTSGRVYLLDFVASSRQQFFWLQEPKTDNDEEYSTKINDYLTNGPPQTAGINQQQQGLMNMLQQVGSGSSNRQQQQTRQVQMDQLQQIMQSINPNARPQQQNQSQTGNQQQQQQQQGGQVKGPSLMQVLSTDAVCAAVQRHGDDFVRQLAEYLPEDNCNVQTICDHIRSAQFKQMTAVFHNALATGQLEGVMPSFGLDPIVANPYYGGVEPFLNAVQEQENKNNSDENKDNKDKDNMDTSEQ